MKLLTKAIEKKLPALYATENVKPDDKICQVKFFDPCGGWTWLAVEYDPVEKLFFGWVDGFEAEWGYFSLDELASVRNRMGLGIERDLYFTPKPMKEIDYYQRRM